MMTPIILTIIAIVLTIPLIPVLWHMSKAVAAFVVSLAEGYIDACKRIGEDLFTRKPRIDGDYVHYGSHTFQRKDINNLAQGLLQIGRAESPTPTYDDQPMACYPEQHHQG
jgi:hypothetical protein